MLKTDSFWWNEAVWINETNRFYRNHLQRGMESCIGRSWETSVCFSSVRRGERARGVCLHLRLQKVKSKVMVEDNLCWRLATWLPAGPREEHEGSENARPDTIQGTGRLNRGVESLSCKKRKNRENERKREKERQRERERETPSNTSAVLVCWNHILKPGVKNDPTRQREWLCR